ncbi:sensor histidine kinase [Polymorphobacter fuscus]|uniref:histidine kinase n=1 Tax=Sandarakinorhabdus fusca TaxID=1439888 RepID=A0A7C9GQG9_9SPHN|nr:sensor histidine kinase [Polymorphobacter fuscus]KAB7644484.1 histidine kinase [Polymorphobacter fuscus]MQT18412.1 histidine kinase [Polymorphobacter fuscus]NJC08312.1 two-component sensor histidine kinase [Polymorphobacter fuscus]
MQGDVAAGALSQHVWSAQHLRLAIDAASVALWSWDLVDDSFAMDDHAFELWAIPWALAVSFETMSARIHPADRDRVRAAFTATRSVPGPFEIDFRIIVDDDIRWISARGHAPEAGDGETMMYGVFLDVTGRKQAEEGNELLAGEMSHRVKNLLAIAGALTRISSQSALSVEEMTQQLMQRLSSLGRAHDLVRPLPGEQGTAALLGDLLSVLLSPYDDSGAFSGRIRVAVPRMGVGESTANTLAMVIHELATNSVKHGALSAEDGMLDVSGHTENDMLHIVWAETGGPDVDHIPEMTGFGSRMIQRSVATQLGGSLDYDWQESGLVVTLSMRKDRLDR